MSGHPSSSDEPRRYVIGVGSAGHSVYPSPRGWEWSVWNSDHRRVGVAETEDEAYAEIQKGPEER